MLVESLAADWGSIPVTAGKIVWFEVGPAASRTGTQRLTALLRAAVPLAAAGAGCVRPRRIGPYVFPPRRLAVA